MDKLPEGMHEESELGIEIGQMKPACLAYVDDATTLAIGYKQQEMTLKEISEFAVKHQLEWGVEKCKVMEIGTHKEKQTQWDLGGKNIGVCQNYKYLGEIISRNGKNADNLSERQKKVIATVRQITNCGKNAIMKKIQTKILLKLHETVLIPSLLAASETWTLNKEERTLVNKMEIMALKSMFGLPPTTPTPALIFVTGCLYAEIRVGIRQLLYLQKLLQRDPSHWAKETLMLLRENNIGWAAKMIEMLEAWGLETDWDKIAKKSKGEWKVEVEIKAEEVNKKKLLEECHVKERGNLKLKTKTKTMIEEINHCEYVRKPTGILTQLTVLETRAFIMGKYGMLSCGANYTMRNGGKDCNECGELDDENHRINDCVLYKHVNLYDNDEKFRFSDIFSKDAELIKQVIKKILATWDLGFGKNTMRTC